MAGAAANLASQPYTPFPGPTVATPSGATKSAWDMAENNLGTYKPYLDQAGKAIGTAASPISAGDISTFLNPYQSYITGALNRNLMTNILPGVQDKFVGAGQSRSPQEAQVTNNAIYDTQQAVGQSLAGGYQNAVDALLRNRQQMGTSGAQFGQLGALSSELGARDIGQLAASGQAQDIVNQSNLDAAHSRFQEEQNWPYQQLGYLSNIIRGLPIEAAGKTTQTAGTTYLNSQVPQASPFSTFLGATALGNSLGGSGSGVFGFREGGEVKAAPKQGALSMRAPRGALRRPARTDGGALSMRKAA